MERCVEKSGLVTRTPAGRAVAVFTASGVITLTTLPKLRLDVALQFTPKTRACLWDFSQAVWAFSVAEIVAGMASFECTYAHQLSGAWVVADLHLTGFRQAARRLAQHGIARRVFTSYEPALAWVTSEAELPLPRWAQSGRR